MGMNHVLDLDLDFFLSPYEGLNAHPRRLSREKFIPWTEDAVRDFLETQCLLDRTAPKPGRFIIEHIDAFWCWRDLLANGILVSPFSLVHVDAHADLGCGGPCFKYLHGELLHLPVNQRATPKTTFGGIHSSNFISFALACRWLTKVDFVFNKDTPLDDQLPNWAFHNWDVASNILELKQMDPDSLKWFDQQPRAIGSEPAIPCEIHCEDSYRATHEFDFVILAQSPGYTPETSDALISVIREYIRDL